MTPDDDLFDRIKKLFEAEREQTRKLIREENEPLKQGQKRLEERQKRLEERQESQSIILAKVGNDIAQVLSEQQQQRTDIRYLNNDLLRVEEKIDNVARDVKSHKERIKNLEEHTGTQDASKN